MRPKTIAEKILSALALAAVMSACAAAAVAQQQPSIPEVGHEEMLRLRAAAAARPISSPLVRLALTTPESRRQAIDALWGEGLPTADKLDLFDKFWLYADGRFAAFQGITVDWAALRSRYRSEIEGGVSRGRFAAIMNHL